jgi:hypothetical protein
VARILWVSLFLRYVVPIIFRTIVFTLQLAGTAFLAVASGVPQATKRIANHWLQRAVIAGVDAEFDTPLYYILVVVAFLTILAGWIIMSYATVWIVNLII